MKNTYGASATNLIPSISIEQLVNHNDKFVETVVKLGKSTRDFVLKEMPELGKNPIHDPNLSVNHISALCDFLNKKTIIDIKCTGYINETHMKQVLSYYYLSKKRSDLNISKVIVYDAVTGKSIFINLLNDELNL